MVCELCSVLYDTETKEPLYSNDVRSCSVKEVVPDHCSFGLLAFTLVFGHLSWVDAQLCVCAWSFALGQRAWINDKDAFYDLCPEG